MTNNFDLATHPDFVRLYSLQLSQVNEMGEIRSTMNSNFMQISKQLQDMCNNSYSTEIDEIPKIPPDQTKTESSELISLPQTYYQSIINLDKPCYALSILQNPDYIPAKHIKVDIPKFDGTEAEHWIYSARRYFIFNKVPEDQKLLIASFHMEGLARKWFSWMEASNMLSTWVNFVDAVVRKFTKLHYQLPGGKLSKLVQTGTVAEYQSMFEEMCTRVLGLTEYFILEMYISGLKEDIQADVVMGKPADIHEAFELSSMIETKKGPVRTLTYKNYIPKQPKVFPHSSIQQNKTDTAWNSKNSETTSVNKRLSATERAERRSKGLCFSCDERFSANHNSVCVGRKGRLFRMSADETEFVEIEEQEEGEHDTIKEDEEVADIVQSERTEISLHAFEGYINSSTIRVEGFVKCQAISVLIDSGSSHNFMQVDVAIALKLTVCLIVPFYVSTGSGEKLVCNKVCRDVLIKVQDVEVKMDIFLIKMAGANMVMGVQALKIFGKVTFDFENSIMEFCLKGKKITWVGLPWISEDPLTQGQLKYFTASTHEAYLCYIERVEEAEQRTALAPKNSEITSVVQEYCELFEEPCGLPPQRERDHAIHLHPGAEPVNVRPYRYPQFQKSKIERLIAEMLKQGIIKSSSSPFSSPVLLVKKN